MISPYTYAGMAPKAIDTELVIAAVEKVTGIQRRRFLSDCRKKELVHARKLLYFSLNKHCNLGWDSMSRFIPKDRATIKSSLLKAKKEADFDEKLKTDISAVSNVLSLDRVS